MKIVVDVKKTRNSTKFEKDDVIIYDGKDWYVTTKGELFAELEAKVNNAISMYDRKYNELNSRFAELSKEYNEQMSKLIPILKNILEEK